MGGQMTLERELIVVMKAEVAVRARAEGVASAAGVNVGLLASVLTRANAALRPLFGASEERIRYETSNIVAAAGIQIPDLSVYYRAEAPDDQLDALAGELARLDVVLGAYVKPPAEPARINDMAPALEEAPPATPDFVARQGYLDSGPGGIDARHAWTLLGGGGANVRIIDIEGAWRFSHEDLTQNQGGVVGGTQSPDIGWRNHGTAVIGEFGGDRNGLGVTGICPDANVRAISIFGGLGSAGAIRQAANTLNPGDIILIELHRPGPRFNLQQRQDQRGYVAIEWWPDDFDAIRFATGQGVIVVEAAGNGAENLDDAIYNAPAPGFPAGWTNPFNRANRDSRAIVVGAGAPPPGTHGNDHGPDRSRLDFSNFGALVDAQGWGREVTTCGYGDLQGGQSEDFWYTDRFSGTSSASPIVVGALGCVQGVLRARGLAALDPAQARQCLRTTGSPQQDAPGRPATERIGTRPELRALLACALGKGLKEIKELKEKDKERKEFKEKERKEIKEIKEKDKDRKEFKEKERKELKEKDKDRKEFKEWKEKDKDKDIFEGWGRELGGPGAGESMEQRLARLESAVEQLTHFITGELRPDLALSALSHEADVVGALGQEMEKHAADAKHAKDQKDVEKLRER
jgi:Subtilase family